MKKGWRNCVSGLAGMVLAISAGAASTPQRVATDLGARVEQYVERHVVAEDGSEVSHYRQVNRLLKADEADHVRKYSISHSASAQRLEIVEAFTRKANGRKLVVPKSNYQLKTASGRSGAAALFSDWNETAVVFPDLQVGDAAEISYRIVTRQPLFPGHFSRVAEFSRSVAFDKVDITVDAPRKMKLQFVNWHMGFSRQEQGTRQLLRWTLAQPQALVNERRDYSVYAQGTEPGYAVSSFESPRDIAKRYVERAEPKAVVTSRIQALADQITAGAEGPKAQANLLYDWVSREIGYAGNCVGIGAVVPRDLGVVLDNRMGDCKDHATLLQALLAAKGIPSHQVLVNSGNLYALPEVPVLSMVNHVINYLPSLGLFLDSTDPDAPFGQLPVSVQDKPVLAASADVPARTPGDDGRARQTMDARYRIGADGSFEGEVRMTAEARFGQMLRVGFKSLSQDQRDGMVKRHFESARIPADGQMKRYSDPQQRTDQFEYEASFKTQPLLRTGAAGAFGIGPMLFSPAPVPAYAHAALQPAPDHAVLCFSSASEETYEITLPENMQVLSIPTDTAYNGPLVSYESSYRLEGRLLHVKRRIADRMPSNVCSPEVIAAYREALQPMLNDLRQQVLYK